MERWAMKTNGLMGLSRAVGTALLVLGLLLASREAKAQAKKSGWSAAEGPSAQTLRGVRGLADDGRAKTTMATALEIRKLPAGEHKVMLASHLANLSTEGDFGKATLQEVTTTLAQAV